MLVAISGPMLLHQIHLRFSSSYDTSRYIEHLPVADTLLTQNCTTMPHPANDHRFTMPYAAMDILPQNFPAKYYIIELRSAALGAREPSATEGPTREP